MWGNANRLPKSREKFSKRERGPDWRQEGLWPTFLPRRKAATQKLFVYLHAVERLSDRSDDGTSEAVNEKLAGLIRYSKAGRTADLRHKLVVIARGKKRPTDQNRYCDWSPGPAPVPVRERRLDQRLVLHHR